MSTAAEIVADDRLAGWRASFPEDRAGRVDRLAQAETAANRSEDLARRGRVAAVAVAIAVPVGIWDGTAGMVAAAAGALAVLLAPVPARRRDRAWQARARGTTGLAKLAGAEPFITELAVWQIAAAGSGLDKAGSRAMLADTLRRIFLRPDPQRSWAVLGVAGLLTILLDRNSTVLPLLATLPPLQYARWEYRRAQRHRAAVVELLTDLFVDPRGSA